MMKPAGRRRQVGYLVDRYRVARRRACSQTVHFRGDDVNPPSSARNSSTICEARDLFQSTGPP